MCETALIVATLEQASPVKPEREAVKIHLGVPSIKGGAVPRTSRESKHDDPSAREIKTSPQVDYEYLLIADGELALPAAAGFMRCPHCSMGLEVEGLPEGHVIMCGSKSARMLGCGLQFVVRGGAPITCGQA